MSRKSEKLRELVHVISNLVTDTAIYDQFLLFARGLFRKRRRIVEGPVDHLNLPGEHGACLGGLAANRDDEIDVFGKEVAYVVGLLGRNVHTGLLHPLDCKAVDTAELDPGRKRIELVAV